MQLVKLARAFLFKGLKVIPKSLLISASLAAGLAASGSTFAATVERVTLDDHGGKMTVTASMTTIPAGKVTFKVVNKGSQVHEMLVVKLSAEQVKSLDAIPYDEKDAKLLEDKVDDKGEVSELEPNQTGSLSINLKKGDYLLVCNIPGHFKAGMYTRLTVQ